MAESILSLTLSKRIGSTKNMRLSQDAALRSRIRSSQIVNDYGEGKTYVVTDCVQKAFNDYLRGKQTASYRRRQSPIFQHIDQTIEDANMPTALLKEIADQREGKSAEQIEVLSNGQPLIAPYYPRTSREDPRLLLSQPSSGSQRLPMTSNSKSPASRKAAQIIKPATRQSLVIKTDDSKTLQISTTALPSFGVSSSTVRFKLNMKQSMTKTRDLLQQRRNILNTEPGEKAEQQQQPGVNTGLPSMIMFNSQELKRKVETQIARQRQQHIKQVRKRERKGQSPAENRSPLDSVISRNKKPFVLSPMKQGTLPSSSTRNIINKFDAQLSPLNSQNSNSRNPRNNGLNMKIETQLHTPKEEVKAVKSFSRPKPSLPTIPVSTQRIQVKRTTLMSRQDAASFADRELSLQSPTSQITGSLQVAPHSSRQNIPSSVGKHRRSRMISVASQIDNSVERLGIQSRDGSPQPSINVSLTGIVPNDYSGITFQKLRQESHRRKEVTRKRSKPSLFNSEGKQQKSLSSDEEDNQSSAWRDQAFNESFDSSMINRLVIQPGQQHSSRKLPIMKSLIFKK